ncbi:hypothetical protein KC669_00475 [Candidatus Dojkabacteria bacterium]|uniref:Uncharacterized protein n=1 Tax=Candidatus Dojkabacteria bacterium TaxID=2099670 RepID=A0A955LAE6_9BACT|nr:hypothetical protein [Candidatus Dojkabacteria bacterium]
MSDDGANFENSETGKNVPPQTLVENIAMTLNFLNLQQKLEHSSEIPELFKLTYILANEFPSIDSNYPTKMKVDIGIAFSAAKTMRSIDLNGIANNYFDFGGILPGRVNPPDRYIDTIIGSIELSPLILNIGVSSLLVMEKVKQTVESNGYPNINFYSDSSKYILHFFIYRNQNNT